MARRRRYGRVRRYYQKARRRVGGMTIPVAPLAAIISTPIVGSTVQALLDKNFPQALKYMGEFGGVNSNTGQFDIGTVTQTYTPIVAGLLVHKVVGGWLGVNRVLAKNKIPLLRV